MENNKIFKLQNNQQDYIIFDFEYEKENILRLDRGVNDLIATIEKYVKIFEERTNSLKNIFDLTKNIDISVLSLRKYQEKDLNEGKANEDLLPKNANNILKDGIFEKLFEKNRSYKDNINSNILDKLKVN